MTDCLSPAASRTDAVWISEGRSHTRAVARLNDIRPHKLQRAVGPFAVHINPCGIDHIGTLNPHFVVWLFELGLGTLNPRFVAWPLELGLGTPSPRFVLWPPELGLGTLNPRFVAWPLELGLGTLNPRFVAWPLELGLGTLNPSFVVWLFELGLGTLNPRFVAWPLELGLGTLNPRFVAWPQGAPQPLQEDSRPSWTGTRRSMRGRSYTLGVFLPFLPPCNTSSC